MDDLPDLRADLRAQEPDDVLLAQLVELSRASTAAAASRPLRPVRALSMGAAALGLVATTSWIAGALPGVSSPLDPLRDSDPAPTSPATPGRTDDVRGPDDISTPGATRPHTRAPGVGLPTWTPPGRPSSGPPTPGDGRAVGRGDAKHPDHGKRVGEQRRPAQPGTRRDATGAPAAPPREPDRSREPDRAEPPATVAPASPALPKESPLGPSSPEASTGP